LHYFRCKQIEQVIEGTEMQLRCFFRSTVLRRFSHFETHFLEDYCNAAVWFLLRRMMPSDLRRAACAMGLVAGFM